MFIAVSWYTLPDHSIKQDLKLSPKYSPRTPRQKAKVLTYGMALKDVSVLMIGSTVTLALV